MIVRCTAGIVALPNLPTLIAAAVPHLAMAVGATACVLARHDRAA
jgi:hypothetical protein